MEMKSQPWRGQLIPVDVECLICWIFSVSLVFVLISMNSMDSELIGNKNKNFGHKPFVFVLPPVLEDLFFALERRLRESISNVESIENVKPRDLLRMDLAANSGIWTSGASKILNIKKYTLIIFLVIFLWHFFFLLIICVWKS